MISGSVYLKFSFVVCFWGGILDTILHPKLTVISYFVYDCLVCDLWWLIVHIFDLQIFCNLHGIRTIRYGTEDCWYIFFILIMIYQISIYSVWNFLNKMTNISFNEFFSMKIFNDALNWGEVVIFFYFAEKLLDRQVRFLTKIQKWIISW